MSQAACSARSHRSPPRATASCPPPYPRGQGRRTIAGDAPLFYRRERGETLASSPAGCAATCVSRLHAVRNQLRNSLVAAGRPLRGFDIRVDVTLATRRTAGSAACIQRKCTPSPHRELLCHDCTAVRFAVRPQACRLFAPLQLLWEQSARGLVLRRAVDRTEAHVRPLVLPLLCQPPQFLPKIVRRKRLWNEEEDEEVCRQRPAGSAKLQLVRCCCMRTGPRLHKLVVVGLVQGDARWPVSIPPPPTHPAFLAKDRVVVVVDRHKVHERVRVPATQFMMCMGTGQES